MLIVTKEKEIELKLKTRLMLLLEERLHIEDTQLFWQKAAQAGNIRILTTAVLILSDGALKKLTKERLKAWLEEPALELGEIVNRAVDKVAEGMVASELGAR